MASTGTVILLAATAAVGAWWLFLRKSYFVDRTSLGSYEYFDDLEAARAYAKKIHGSVYEISAGGEFDSKTARRLTPNRRRKSARKVARGRRSR